MCRMLTRGVRRNDFAVWTVLTHLFRVRRSSHVPSPLLRPQQQRLTVSVLPGNTKLGLGGERQTRFDRRFDHSPGHIDRKRTPLRTCHGLWFAVHATSSGPLWCTGTGLQLWSVVCGVRGLPFYISYHIISYHITSLHPLPYTAILMATVTLFCGADVW